MRGEGENNKKRAERARERGRGDIETGGRRVRKER